VNTRRLLALALATVLLAAGCSDGEITKTKGDVRIWLHESGFVTGGLDGEVFGTMTYDRTNRCMYLEHDGRLSPVIWPSGTRIESEDPIALTAKGETINEGDSVYGSGGYHDAGRFEGLIPTECHGTSAEVARFNADSEIAVTRP